MTSGEVGALYRGASVVDLVPVRQKRPVGIGIRFEQGKGTLDISIGGIWLHGRRVVELTLLLPQWIIFLYALLRGSLPWTFVFGVWVPLSIAFLVQASGIHRHDRLAFKGTSLLWQRFRRGSKLIHEESAELTRITGVHDAGDYVRVDLDDGTHWEVGRDLRVPARVRQWVAGHIAQSLPMPPHRRLIVGSEPASTPSDD